MRFWVVGCLVLLAVLLVGSIPIAQATHEIPARVTRVANGDTLTVYMGNGTKLRVRLLGIDAPELPHGATPGQPFAREARDYLVQLVSGKRIRVQIFGTDRDKHALGVVWVGNRAVNVELVRAGLADVDRGAPCQAQCRELKQAERQARQDRVGMWAQGAKYESPAAFRKRMHLGGG